MRKKRTEKYITIKDVAKEAGVSIATVSRVINNGVVRDQKRKSVLDAIKKLDYVPNNSARNLAAVNATKRIMLLVPSISLPCYIDLIKGFKMGAYLYKYDPIINEYDFDVIQYEKINREVLRSSEIKAVVQVGFREEIVNKIVINMDDEMLKLDIGDKYQDKNFGLYFPGDEILTDYFKENIFTGENGIDVTAKMNSNLDAYVTQTIEQAAKLLNDGINKPIYTLEETEQIGKLVNNIATLPVDFYAIGIALSRIAIKRITGKFNEEEEALHIAIK